MNKNLKPQTYPEGSGYGRKELIAICEKAIVPQEKWTNRDSESAQHNVGRVWQLLKCGCEYRIITKEDRKDFITEYETIVLMFWVHSFMWFENFEEDRIQEGYEKDSHGEWLNFYLPTMARLKKAKGEDWY